MTVLEDERSASKMTHQGEQEELVNKLPWPSAQAQHNYPTVRAASDCGSQYLESTKKKKEAMAEHWTGDFKKMGGKAAVRRELRVSK